MKIINLDEMCPESVTIIHGGKEYILAPMGTEQLLKVVPIWEKYNAEEANLGDQFSMALEFLAQALPEIPAEGLRKLTAVQLRHLMNAVMETVGLVEPKEEEEAGEDPKAKLA